MANSPNAWQQLRVVWQHCQLSTASQQQQQVKCRHLSAQKSFWIKSSRHEWKARTIKLLSKRLVIGSARLLPSLLVCHCHLHLPFGSVFSYRRSLRR